MKFDTVIIGAGESGLKMGMQQLAQGRTVAIISAGKSTISIRHAAKDIGNYIPRLQEGVQLEAELKRNFRNGGGIILEGDEAVSAVLAKDSADNALVASVKTRRLDDEPIVADTYYLASGSFVSRGLMSTYTGVYEPVFGIDIADAPAPGSLIAEDFFASHAYARVHVATDSEGHALKDGKPIVNLYPIGTISTGYTNCQNS